MPFTSKTADYFGCILVIIRQKLDLTRFFLESATKDWCGIKIF